MTLKAALLALPATLTVAACGGGSQDSATQDREASPYARLQKRSIRALSERRVADLLAGRGAGYALAAELNHYPGPMHVLELADQLELTAPQRSIARAESAAVHARAPGIGRQLVAAERRLDALFRTGSATANVAALTARIARLDSALRHIHLRAHVRMREALTRRQLARYDVLRGYGSRPRAHAGGEHGHRFPPPP